MRFQLPVLALCFLLLGASPSNGQASLEPCGTSPELSEILARYHNNPGQYARLEGIVQVPLTIYILGESNGSGYFSIHRLMDAFCTLNRDFEPTGIQFYILGEINYINNSAWYAHPGFQAGAEMMAAHRVENTLNCYIVEDPAGNCGYASSNGAALAKSCLFPDDHTWAHEIGHMLGLPHPFLGWEGYEHPYATPAPAFINNRPVEKTDGSNCYVAGDRFCDTSPDYLNFRWSCNEDSESYQLQTDPDGVNFRSDGTLIMSYSNDECANRFSEEQISAMQFSLQDFWAGLAFGQDLPGDIPGAQITLTAPVGGASVPGDAEVTLSWEPVPNATQYIVEVSRLPEISFTVAQVITPTNSAVITGLPANKEYFWRVRPYNARYTCTDFSSVESFSTDALSSVAQPELLSSIELHPNPLPSGQALTATINARQRLKAGIRLFTATGVKVMDWGQYQIEEGEQQIELPGGSLPGGLYLLEIATPRGKAVKKVAIGVF